MTRVSRWWRHPLADVLQFLVLVVALGALIASGASGMGYQWKWDQVPRYLVKVIDGQWIAGPLLRGLGVTLDISWKAGILSVLFGTVVVALRLSRSRSGPALAWLYVEVIRNTPLLVQVLVFYFIVAAVLGIERLAAGILCLALYEAAFVAEIIRGGLAAVPRGQREAGLSLGLSPFRVLQKVTLPQALPIMLPPLTGVLVNLVKHSAIVSVIAVFDLTTEARTIVADTFMAFEIWLVTAGLYLLITVTLSLLVAWLERRMAQQRVSR